MTTETTTTQEERTMPLQGEENLTDQSTTPEPQTATVQESGENASPQTPATPSAVADMPVPSQASGDSIATAPSQGLEETPSAEARAGQGEEPSISLVTSESLPAVESAAVTPTLMESRSEAVEEGRQEHAIPTDVGPQPEGESPAESEAEEAERATRRKAKKRVKLTPEEARPIWDELIESFDKPVALPFSCIRAIPGGMLVSYKGLEGFIPRSQFLLDKRAEQQDMIPFVGQDVQAVVIEIGEFDKRKYVCSRKKALRLERLQQIRKGEVFEGVVTAVTDYGAFVDIGGIDGLVHISRMSKIRVTNPADVVKVNDKVKVRVVEVDLKHERIALSMREFTESPWSKVREKYPVGSLVKGRIKDLLDYGAYVVLEEGIVGMIHVSELSWTRRLRHPNEVVRVGQEVEARVLEVRPSDRRISLSLKAAQPDPWPRLANIYHAGAEATGTVKRVMDAGAIVSLDYDIDCFVPRGKIGSPRRGGRRTAQDISVKPGDTVQVKVIEMDPDKKSFICAIVREEELTSGDESEGTFGSLHSPSDRAYTLGDIPALKNLFKSQGETPAPRPVGEKQQEPSMVQQPATAGEQPLATVPESSPTGAAPAQTAETTVQSPSSRGPEAAELDEEAVREATIEPTASASAEAALERGMEKTDVPPTEPEQKDEMKGQDEPSSLADEEKAPETPSV
ncbi:MAG: S1 RNA-binding domain-containing protein [Bacteroidota bacterium]|nr:S1 RNA-binding domain-containing protein [Bacteroidota bacterium]